MLNRRRRPQAAPSLSSSANSGFSFGASLPFVSLSIGSGSFGSPLPASYNAVQTNSFLSPERMLDEMVSGIGRTHERLMQNAMMRHNRVFSNIPSASFMLPPFSISIRVAEEDESDSESEEECRQLEAQRILRDQELRKQAMERQLARKQRQEQAEKDAGERAQLAAQREAREQENFNEYSSFISKIKTLELNVLEMEIGKLPIFNLWRIFPRFPHANTPNIFSEIAAHPNLDNDKKYTLLNSLLNYEVYFPHYEYLLMAVLRNQQLSSDRNFVGLIERLYFRYLKDTMPILDSADEYRIWEICVREGKYKLKIVELFQLISNTTVHSDVVELRLQFITLWLSSSKSAAEVIDVYETLEVINKNTVLESYQQEIKEMAKHAILFLELTAAPNLDLTKKQREAEDKNKKSFLNDNWWPSVHTKHVLELYNMISDKDPDVIRQCEKERQIFETKLNAKLKARGSRTNPGFHLAQKYYVRPPSEKPVDCKTEEQLGLPPAYEEKAPALPPQQPSLSSAGRLGLLYQPPAATSPEYSKQAGNSKEQKFSLG